MKIFYFVIFLLCIVSGSLESCNKILNRLILYYEKEGKDKLLQLVSPYIEVSGNSPWSYGDYDACIRRGYSYSTVVIQSFIYPLPMGFCHSKECTSQDLEDESIQAKVREFLKESHILDPYINVDNFSYEMKDPNSNQDLHRCETIITIALIVAVALISIIDPLNQIISKREIIQCSINDSIENIQIDENESSIFQKFSITRNYQEFININENMNMGIFDGFRSIACLMVIFGHSFSEFAGFVKSYDYLRILDQWISLVIGDFLYAVDIFYWIGGFFIGYILFQNQKVNQLKKHPQGVIFIILHRIFRIWPCYLFAIMFHCFIGQKIGGGPRWFMTDIQFQTEKCWQNLLFIDNLFQDDNFCFGWGWYLSSDMQIFLSCIIPLLIYSKSRRNGKIAIYILFIITFAFSIQVSFQYGYTLEGLNILEKGYFHNYYIKSYCRAPPYYVGLLLGIMFREHKQGEETVLGILNQQAKKSKKFRRIIIFCNYFIGIAIILFLCLGWRGLQVSKDRQNYGPQWIWHLWNGICRPFLVIGLSFLIIPSLLGFRDLFNSSLMNCTAFRLLAKLSFCVYLLHYTVITIIMGSFYETPEYNFQSQFAVFIVSTVVTISLAFLLHLLVELPFQKLEKQLMNSIVRRKQQQSEQKLE